MLFPLFLFLLLAALVLTLVHAAGKAPLWPAVFLVIVALIVEHYVR